MGNYNKGYRKKEERDSKEYLHSKRGLPDNERPINSERKANDDSDLKNHFLKAPVNKIMRKVYYLNIVAISIIVIIVIASIYLFFYYN